MGSIPSTLLWSAHIDVGRGHTSTFLPYRTSSFLFPDFCFSLSLSPKTNQPKQIPTYQTHSGWDNRRESWIFEPHILLRCESRLVDSLSPVWCDYIYNWPRKRLEERWQAFLRKGLGININSSTGSWMIGSHTLSHLLRDQLFVILYIHAAGPFETAFKVFKGNMICIKSRALQYTLHKPFDLPQSYSTITK